MSDSHETLKNIADSVVGVVVVATWIELLPAIAAGAALLYTIMRIIIEWPRLVCAVKRWFS